MSYTAILLSFSISIVLGENGFIASFQTSDSWSTDEWMEYEKEISKMKEFTTCFWAKIKHFPADYVAFWQYCGVEASNQVPKSMECVQFYLRPNVDSGNRHMDIYGWVQSNEVMVNSERFKHRSWNHFCWSYSTQTGKNMFYHNGHLIGTKTMPSNNGIFPSMKGDKGYEEHAFIIGQEQDWIRGKYESSQVYSGDITELNMWNVILKDSTIASMASCKTFDKGNIVAWERKSFKVNTKISNVNNSGLEFLCSELREHIIFPEKLALSNANALCKAHGGYIAIPGSNSENEKLLDMTKSHKEKCLENPNPLQEGRALWLGIKPINKSIYEILHNGQLVDPPVYMNWDKFTPFYPNLGCSFMQNDGFWGFKDSDTCNKLELCTVCTLDEVPIFTLKGLPPKVSFVDRNYYVITNSSNQISYYDGFTLSKMVMGNNKAVMFSQHRSIERKMNQHPLGRGSWTWSDERNGFQKNITLTLSACIFGNDFTCKSGQCVLMKFRCDGIQHCNDGTDENDCEYVTISDSYQLSQPPKLDDTGDIAVPIETHINIISFDKIDTVKMILGVTAEIELKWNDNRITFTNIIKGENDIPEEVARLLWSPMRRIVHENAVIGSLHKDEITAVKVKLSNRYSNQLPPDLSNNIEDAMFSGSLNPLIMRQRFKTEYNCNFNLEKFPFDQQHCSLILKMEIKNHSKISLIKNSAQRGIYNGSTTVHEFKISNIYEESEATETETKFLVHIWLNRNYMNQLLNTFFPSFLLWVLAYSTLLIKTDDFTDRIMVTVTSLLVLVSLLASVSNALPVTSYFKYIDLWFVYYVSGIFMITVYHILLDMVETSSQESKENLKNTRIFRISPFNPNDKVKKDHEYDVPSKRPQERKTWINGIALIMFPAITVVFNLVYFLLTTGTVSF